MNIGPVNAQYEVARHQEIVRSDKKHLETIREQQHIKQQRVENEEKRIEANRRMNRAGQNVDRMA